MNQLSFTQLGLAPLVWHSIAQGMKTGKLLTPLEQQSVPHPATPRVSWELAASLFKEEV